MVYTWKDALEDIGVSLNNKIAAKVHYFNTIADMKASNILRVGDMVITKGYYTTNDGGNGEYEIVNDASLVDDGGSVHDIYGGLKAKLIIRNNCINIKQFGAYGDEKIDCTIEFTNASKFGMLNLFNQIYKVDQVILSNDLKIFSESNASIKDARISINTNLKIIFENITFINTRFSLSNYENIIFKNCIFKDNETSCIDDNGGNKIEFYNCTVKNMGTSITDTESSNSGVINYGKLYFSTNVNQTNLLIANNVYGENGRAFGGCGFYIQKVKEIYIENCKFKDTRHSPIYFYSSIEPIGYIKNCESSGITPALVYSGKPTTKNIDLIGNKIYNSISNGLEGTYNNVRNNIIDGSGVNASNYWGAETEGMYVRANVIENNIINNSAAEGIELNNIQVKKMIVKNNIITNTGLDGIKFQVDNTIDNAFDDVVIERNTIHNTGLNGTPRTINLIGKNISNSYNAVIIKNNNLDEVFSGGDFLGVNWGTENLINTYNLFQTSLAENNLIGWKFDNGTCSVEANNNITCINLASNNSSTGCTLYQELQLIKQNGRYTIVVETKSNEALTLKVEFFDASNTYLSSKTISTTIPTSSDFVKHCIGYPGLNNMGGKIKISIRTSNAVDGSFKIKEFSMYSNN